MMDLEGGIQILYFQLPKGLLFQHELVSSFADSLSNGMAWTVNLQNAELKLSSKNRQETLSRPCHIHTHSSEWCDASQCQREVMVH